MKLVLMEQQIIDNTMQFTEHVATVSRDTEGEVSEIV